MNAFSNLDRETFQQVLASAFVVQESQIDRKSLSAVMELEQLVARGELDLDGAMYQVAECARNVANATGVAIALLKGGQLIHRAGSGSAASDIGRQVTAALTVSAHVDGTREILRVEDAQTDKRIEASVRRQFRARSLLILPIYQTRTLVGVLEVMFGEPHAFQDAEVLIYQLMARRIEASILQAAPLKRKQSPLLNSQSFWTQFHRFQIKRRRFLMTPDLCPPFPRIVPSVSDAKAFGQRLGNCQNATSNSGTRRRSCTMRGTSSGSGAGGTWYWQRFLPR
jgi:putative methionine-R-sulfoxide reductase with GAF domain